MNKKVNHSISVDDTEGDEEYYDSHGRPSPGGLYDAGGHIIAERFADYADYLYDQMKDMGGIE
jgi:hypothetical protein